MKRKKTRPPQAEADDVAAAQETLRRLPEMAGYEGAEAARAAYDQAAALSDRFPQDAEARRSHVQARDRYNEALRRAFPPTFSQSMDRLRAHDPAGLEDAVAFLEADPIFYGTGYGKEDLIQMLRDVDIPAAYVSRLQAVVLSIVDRRDGREFRAFCRLARKVDAPALRDELTRRLTNQDADVRRRARWVLEALEQGEKHAPKTSEGMNTSR